MKALVAVLIASLFAVGFPVSCTVPAPTDERARLRELDAYWAEVSRAVREGDFEAYENTCHHIGVLVSGIKQSS
ncbi:hypothetical protein OAF58_00355 [bacterium]|nr:hypothetical protein [bacterium]